MSFFKASKALFLAFALGCIAQTAHSAAAPTNAPASSIIREQSNGRWLFIDGAQSAALVGAVYQNTAGDAHIRNYTNSLHSLYKGLDESVEGGKGHGARLKQMGISAIRVYELPVDNVEDAVQVKAIFRRLYERHRIKVLIGDWAGLHTGLDFKNPKDLAQIRTHIKKLAATYSNEPWILGWQLGNENNYHIRNGVMGQEIGLGAVEYYAFMDDLAGVLKEDLGKRHLKQFVALGQGDLNGEEADLIASMKNVDAVGINCYRDDPDAFEEVIALGGMTRRPFYFAEVGRPGEGDLTEAQQSEYLQKVCRLILSHCAGGTRSGNVIGVFLHEATDEAWKRFEHGRESDAHYGILGKTAETELGQLFGRYHSFINWVLPLDDSPDALIQAAWQCLEGPFAQKYSRLYGYAMAYASRVITLYEDNAQRQQKQMMNSRAGIWRAASPDCWALNAVGTAYFIIGNAWMLQSYDYEGSEKKAGIVPRLEYWSDFRQSLAQMQIPQTDSAPTNAMGCKFYARQVFGKLDNDYPYAYLRESDGKYRRLDRAVATRFPELIPPYLPLTWLNGIIFIGIGLLLMVGLATLSRSRTAKISVKSVSVMGLPTRILFLLALAFNLACLFWLVNWWFHPVRFKYFTVQPILYWVLSLIGAMGVSFYLWVWHVLWNMRRPVPMKAPEGRRVAIVTTRVASEPVEGFESTLQKMRAVAYPHDSYLLDEENNPAVKARCEKYGVIHFSRKGNPKYNQPSGKFQARTKGGNLNSWLYEHGKKYEFVTFLDPDHEPRPEFLHKVLGYFENWNVAFVQGPQVLKNADANWIARGAAEQSYFFYGPMQMGLFGMGACVVNGSHSTFRVSDLMTLEGDGYAVHDADDILTSMRIHAIDKVGVYVPDVLAEGLAPDTWEEFSKQQRRWAYSMFHLLFYYYLPEFRRTLPLRCKMIYLLLTSFYFRGTAFAVLLFLPFVSAFTGNPAVNANLVAFVFRFLPFLLFHCGILFFLGQRFLVPGGSRRGFWYRAGLLWVAMWWGHLCALVKALRTRRVKDRIVAAKWKSSPNSRWLPILPHLALAVSAGAAFAWIWFQPQRRQTVWGTLLFLAIIVFSQAFIALKLAFTQSNGVLAPQPGTNPRSMTFATAYPQQTGES